MLESDLRATSLQPEPHAVWPANWLVPDWPGPTPRVRALMSGRSAPAPVQPSLPAYADFNLGMHVGDSPDRVASHRAAFAACMGAVPLWLDQVHGARVVKLSTALTADGKRQMHVDDQVWVDTPVQADGSWTSEPGLACTVMVADCLPILLAAPQGRGVAALHSGWRGLCGAGTMQGHGVVEQGVAALCEGVGCQPSELQAWLGACIGPLVFEVGADVLAGFGLDPRLEHNRFKRLFRGNPTPGEAASKWLADLPGLALDRLHALGVTQVSGGTWCTVSEPSRLFSFRRDGVTGRQAASICLLP